MKTFQQNNYNTLTPKALLPPEFPPTATPAEYLRPASEAVVSSPKCRPVAARYWSQLRWSGKLITIHLMNVLTKEVAMTRGKVSDNYFPGY